MPIDRDYYSLLEVGQNASPKEIKAQYRRFAKLYHPDRNPSEREWCTERLMQVKQAFEVLSDPARRAAYDRELQAKEGADPPYRVPVTPAGDVATAAPRYVYAAPPSASSKGYLGVYVSMVSAIACGAVVVFLQQKQPAATIATVVHHVSATISAGEGLPRVTTARHSKSDVSALRSYHRRHHASVYVHLPPEHLTSAELDARAERIADHVEAERRKHGGTGLITVIK